MTIRQALSFRATIATHGVRAGSASGGWSTASMMQDRAGNKMSDDIGKPWDGHYWHIIYWLDGGKHEILRDTNNRLRGYDLTPRRYSRDEVRKRDRAAQPFSIMATATCRADLADRLELLT